MKRKNRPLDGVVVLDLGQVYQGPYATYLMAKAGATVIKIEPPGGEPVRRREDLSKGSGVPFALFNGYKQCITLDLKSEQGKSVLKRLAAKADVLLENYAPGVMDRLGVGWDVLHAMNPRLVYASGSGYGLTGPDRDKLAMDITVQAASGMMSVTGFEDGPPVKAGPAVVDLMSGVHLYAGVVTALYERHFTGVGRLVEVSMQESVYHTMASNLNFYYDHNEVPPRTGNQHGGRSAAPYNVYAVKDGHIAIIGVNDAHWQGLLKVIRREDLTADPRFADKVNRVKHIDETDAVVAEGLRDFTRDQACALLDANKVPYAPVRNIVEVTNDRHMHERGFLEWFEHPRFGRIAIADSPIRIHGTDRLPPAASARLGEHTEEVMTSVLGINRDEFQDLQAAGAFGPASASQPTTSK
ncbi:CaiB/BaiF CoA-transferase family protein [Acidovorax sp. JHL-9]|uniref:CaiB/BaiF CoA transferase family protein n=1 Tax=Acidovorax sp. JHL-9 TaxID=1276756 RepID=UPI000401BE06|nr:CoA transferase [Acidovorax sp. JHL-9]